MIASYKSQAAIRPPNSTLVNGSGNRMVLLFRHQARALIHGELTAAAGGSVSETTTCYCFGCDHLFMGLAPRRICWRPFWSPTESQGITPVLAQSRVHSVAYEQLVLGGQAKMIPAEKKKFWHRQDTPLIMSTQLQKLSICQLVQRETKQVRRVSLAQT